MKTRPQDIQLSGIKHAKQAIADLLNDQADIATERDSLKADNAELRNVLAEIAEACEQYNAKPDPYAMAEHARAALAKANHE